MTDVVPASKKPGLPFEIWALVAGGFTMALGFGVLAPAIPQFALEFGVSTFWASSLISIVAVTRMLGAPFIGWLMSRVGERHTFTIGMVISALATGACAIVVNFPQLLAFRGIVGLGSVATTIATTALLIRLSPVEARGRVASFNSAGFMGGALLGPLLGALLVPFGLRAPFVFHFSMVVIATVIVWLALRRSTIIVFNRSHQSEQATLTTREALRIPQFQSLLLTSFSFNWAVYGVRNAIVPIFAVAVISPDPATAAWVLAAFSLGNTMFILPAGRWNDTIGRRPLLITGLAMTVVTFVTFPMVSNLWLSLAIMVFGGIGAALLNPGQQAVLADVVGSKNAGGLISFYSIVGDLGMAVGPLVAGALVDAAGFGWAFGVTAALLGASTVWWIFVPDSRRLAR